MPRGSDSLTMELIQSRPRFYEICGRNRNSRRNIRFGATLWSHARIQLTQTVRGGRHGSWDIVVDVGCADPGHHPPGPHLALSRGSRSHRYG